MSYAKNKGGSGLKILWIPGRKKHHDKGTFKPTNQAKADQGHPDKKNQMWNLGGSKNYEDIVTSDGLDDTLQITSTATSVVSSASCVTAINAEINVDTEKSPDDKENNEENDDTPTNSNYDAATLVIGEKKNGFSDKKNDFDSIERLDDLNSIPKDDYRHKRKYYPNRKKAYENNDEPDRKEEKTVKCLYYTLMCCECTIS